MMCYPNFPGDHFHFWRARRLDMEFSQRQTQKWLSEEKDQLPSCDWESVCVFFVHHLVPQVRNMDPHCSEQFPPLYISLLDSIFWHKHSQKIEMFVSAHEKTQILPSIIALFPRKIDVRFSCKPNGTKNKAAQKLRIISFFSIAPSGDLSSWRRAEKATWQVRAPKLVSQVRLIIIIIIIISYLYQLPI